MGVYNIARLTAEALKGHGVKINLRAVPFSCEPSHLAYCLLVYCALTTSTS